MYNLTHNSTTYIGFMQFTDGLIGGWLGISILLSIMIISIMSMKAFESRRAFVGAMFVTSTSAIFLKFLGLVQDWAMYAAAVLFFLSIIMLKLTED